MAFEILQPVQFLLIVNLTSHKKVTAGIWDTQ